MARMIIVEGNSNDKDDVRNFMVKGETGDGATIDVVKENGVATITIIDSEGTKTVQILDGEMTKEMVIDALTSTLTDQPLSANQGYVLKSLIDTLDTNKLSISDIIDNLDSTASNKPLSANQGNVLKTSLDNTISDIGNLITMIRGTVLNSSTITPDSAGTLTQSIANFKRIKIYVLSSDNHSGCIEVYNNNANSFITSISLGSVVETSGGVSGKYDKSARIKVDNGTTLTIDRTFAVTYKASETTFAYENNPIQVVKVVGFTF